MLLIGRKGRIACWLLLGSPIAFYLLGQATRLLNGCPLGTISECYTPAAWAHAWQGLALVGAFTAAPAGALALLAHRIAVWRYGA